MRRLTILLVALGALLLVPAAQAFANGNAIITIEGTGKGQLVAGEFLQGNPAVNCSYASPGPATGTCNTELSAEFGVEGVGAKEIAAPGSEFVGWEFEGGTEGLECTGKTPNCFRFQEESAGGDIYITAYFNLEVNVPLTIKTTGGGSVSEFQCTDIAKNENKKCASEYPEGRKIGIDPLILFPNEFEGWTGCDETKEKGKTCIVTMTGARTVSVKVVDPTKKGPTNRRTLTLTKSAGGTGGIGSVSSKPKGINCAAACNSAVASMYESTPVTLTAKPSTGSTFTKWSNPGGACDESASTTCTVPMSEDESLEAVFGGTSKAILNPQPLTLTKGESTGQGTVKASGLTCEAGCTSSVALYQGPTGVAPKNKPGKTVELKATPAYGSSFTGWSGSGCSGTGTCIVTMEEAKEVTATFTAKPTATLTVDKAGTGTGTVTSKPKAISCATVCTTQDATVPTGEAVILKEKPATGMTFEGWTGACVGAGETCSVSLSEAGTVTAKFGGAPKAIANPQALTLTKAGTGLGTIKGTGLTCEVLCTSTVSLYQGPTGIAPKNKPGKTVILKALSAPGSAQVAWSGCLSEPTPTECSVTMEAAQEVTATFNELP